MPRRCPRPPRACRTGALAPAAAVLAMACLATLAVWAPPVRADRAGKAAWDESSPLAGRTLVEKLSSAGQLDRLDDTTTDSLRATCAVTLSAYLLLGGDFAVVARELGVKPKLTYENLHRVQDALYRQCDRDGMPGILAAAEAVYDTSDVLVDWSMRGGDEYHLVLQKLNMSAERIYGPTRATVDRKGDRVRQLLAEDSTRVFVVGVYEDMDARTSHELTDETAANHYVLAFWYDGAFHALDSWRPPGEPGLVRWSDETAESMLLDTRNAVYWVWRR